MIRKRAAFKPNLNQIATSQAPTNGQQQPAPAPPPQAGAQVAAPEPAGSQQTDATTPQQRPRSPTKSSANDERNNDDAAERNASTTGPRVGLDHVNPTSEPLSPTRRQSEDESSKRFHEAITQLTGQQFEPIKSISLRNSANKNVKLKDLLFFNPPLTKDQKRHKKSVHLAKRRRLTDDQQSRPRDANDDNINDSRTIDSNDSNEVAREFDEPCLVPKVKLGPDGKLILDESSMVINRKNSIKTQEAIVEDNEEVISRTNYDSYRRKPTSTSQTKWSLEDTQKFYHALTILGTDFSMMESLLFSGHRSRTELHKKFKREERMNKVKIDIALSNRISLTSEELDGLKDVFYN